MSEQVNFEQIYEGAIKDGVGPKKLFKQCYDGTIVALSYAEILLNKAIKKYGEKQPVGYPDTAYYLPAIRALSGEEVTVLGDLVPILNRMRDQVKEELTFANALLCGESTIYAAEIIEAVRYLDRQGEKERPEPWTGFIGDPVVRKFGIKMVDWTIPGEAVIVGRARDSKAAKKLADDLMSKGMMMFLVDEINEQMLEENVKLGLEFAAYPLGNFTQVIHAVNYALRAGMMFAGIKPGLRDQHRKYQRDRVRAFVLALGERDIVKVAASFAAIFLGFPVIVDQELDEDEILPDWYFPVTDYDSMIQTALEVRGIKIAASAIELPINYGPAFEGETIRKNDMYVEFGGGRSPGYELVQMGTADEVEDGKIELIGPDVDEMEEGKAYPLGLEVKIYGRKFQEDFEPVVERRIHYFANYGEGLWHVAQRDLMWVRISKDAYAKGLRMKHIGELLMAKFKEEFAAIIDRVQVRVITDPAVVEEGLKAAREKYRAREERMRGLTDEAVEDFYTCTLCQSFAPNHVCMVTPERLGLCGAVNWLDAKASYEINPNGPNQPIQKGEPIDEKLGMYPSVNAAVYERSNRSVEECSMYSLMTAPMTSCGCFECIIAMVPECNGIIITTREHTGQTPVGMTFSTLAGMVGGGVQTPGFMGIGRQYIVSRKFIQAEGGIARIVWMPKELKEFLREDFIKRSVEQGLGEDFIDKIADEEVGTTVEEIMPFLEEKGHPALTMEMMF